MANSRGFSSIVGAVFAVLVMISLISTVFVWSLSQNTLYNNTVTQTRQAELDRANEKIVADVNVSRVTGTTTVWANGTLENDGPLPVSIVTLWVVGTNASASTYANCSLTIALKSGYNITTATKVALAQLNGESLSCWFISERGNTIPEKSLMTINTSPYWNANVTQGIGSVSMDFSKFNHYEFSSSPDGYNLNSYSLYPLNYTISARKYVVLHVVLTDLDPDPSKPVITLNGNSSLYFLGASSAGQGSSVKWGYWKMLSVTNGVVHVAANAMYTLPWGIPTDIYFYASGGQNGDTDWPAGLYPVNIMVFGQKGNNDYGQNIPFVSVYIA